MRKLIDAICEKITYKIREEMPEIDDERAEIINYGLQLIIRRNSKAIYNAGNCLYIWGI